MGAQSIAHAQSIARRHTTYVIVQKKPTFQEFFFGKIKKEEFARGILRKKSVFLLLKLLNKQFFKNDFFFFDTNVAGSLLWRRQIFADSKTEF